ncbi:Disintegrin and metalloproteinase domain-containing protein 2 [Pteropus alecto]|uniref:Disintegrin and metalloproteinase domain-containing protein 2 n=1 Tax=Pteropus alecto TaxID=9402 RepID=L5KD68_PTEAL|nr:Disintegrin and metalloproteinase domain-containing protein 2 [Pteropus alecto]
MEDFAHFISKPKSQCLQNQPRLDPSYKAAVCGNKQVEEGEQCDCGTQEECEALPDTCCGSTACVLKQGNTCDSGDCCEHCQFKAKGDTCRASLDECDLPEFCNGSSASCQDNVFIHNGYPCGEKQWLCLDGSCVSGKKQCVEIFGEVNNKHARKLTRTNELPRTPSEKQIMLICPSVSTKEFTKQYKFTRNEPAVQKRMRSCLVVFPLPCPVAAAQPNRIPKGELARTENNCSSYPGSLAQCAVHLSTSAREPQSCPTAFSVGGASCALA